MNVFLEGFKPEIIQVAVVALFFVGFLLVALLLNALRRSEWFRQNEAVAIALAQKALELLIHTEYGDEFSTVSHVYEDKALKRSADGLFYVDPRMLFVIDKLELWANTRFGVALEFDDLLQIAETKYQEVKLDPLNDIFAPSKVTFATIEVAPPTE